GQFSAIVWDPAADELIGAVDSFGIGSLFVMRDPKGGRWFASDLPVLRRAFPGALEFDPQVIGQYVSQLPISPERTSFRDVERVPPGSVTVLPARASV